ncbi:hypothetical protein [Amycolatopsis taiwanensis]|uniref:Uncharacterized protein n=1 Tax=Amycolatopsis taiwanensis TaxID=342230 RepID=A0A9W6R310_9PSEU|nr:hypothetical protein [Amycolatopsis taiwanensis]GLY66580.1 hypothetical protein Atai01_31990 [Amycolatopsis taiwanensis]
MVTDRWLEIDWKTPLPDKRAITRSRERLRFEQVSLEHPAIDAMLAELRRLFAGGGALLASFRVFEDDAVAQWFASRNRLQEYGFFGPFLTSEAVRTALPELGAPRRLGDKSLELKWPPGNSFSLDGILAGFLHAGGCYEKFHGTPVEAKRMAGDFTHAIIEDRYDEFLVYHTDQAWARFFDENIPANNTFVIVDKRNAQITLLCLADAD